MRGVVALAMESSIAVETWLNGDARAMWTAMHLLEERNREMSKKGKR